MPCEFNGRVKHVAFLFGLYSQAVDAAGSAAACWHDAAVQTTGVELARAQRELNSHLWNYEQRTEAHAGVPLGLPTQIPISSPNYLSLILVEQRRQAAALESMADVSRRLVSNRMKHGWIAC